jgi:hypothetical protein
VHQLEHQKHKVRQRICQLYETYASKWPYCSLRRLEDHQKEVFHCWSNFLCGQYDTINCRKICLDYKWQNMKSEDQKRQ